jgi:hypothetical protein
VTYGLPQAYLADARLVLAIESTRGVQNALHLGWCLAETRGRNRPGGPPGDTDRMPGNNDHALPLRIERTPAELRIEAQSVVASVARELHVDQSAEFPSFGAELDHKAKLLAHIRVPHAAAAMQSALALLGQPSPANGSEPAVPGAELAVRELTHGVDVQQAVADEQQQALTAAEHALAAAQERLVQDAGQPPDKVAAAERSVARAEAAVQLGRETCDAETSGLATLKQVIATIQQAPPAAASQAGADAIRAQLQAIDKAAEAPWADLAELIWRFDAHVQDQLSAASEDQATAYQLGRGLAETYWALDPDQVTGSTGWTFLLGHERCYELARLTGRLAAYFGEFTAPGIAGSIEVWKEVAKTPAWRAVPHADDCLYQQSRRWYELLILGQDPTTMIKPGAILKDYRAILRTLRVFWPQLAATVVGLAFLVVLLVLLGVGGSTWLKTLSGVVAGVGVSVASISGTLKNSAQAILKRLRQDAYSDLVAFAVQTAPPPPRKSDIRRAIAERELTAATPN